MQVTHGNGTPEGSRKQSGAYAGAVSMETGASRAVEITDGGATLPKRR
ncbi:hypothetical protein SAMCFNEI73_pC0675 (plasmid) [Sinorhizobium americanum]|uniref:Uncharacterized protein n=1 Tax=Sinorhizobium americanum TaxID=194963 RepID=A0A1L3LWB9_9HYPH|nr:hypothetical protein SAMCFNEI73_pC0675 [Sinorhizobium americanum]